MTPKPRLVTYDTAAELTIARPDQAYSLATWSEDGQIFGRVEENGHVVGCYRIAPEETDRWALVDFLNTIFMQVCSPTFLAGDDLKDIAGDIALYQRSLD